MAPGNPRNNVNDLLHRKRGEQFRHQQNILNSRTHVSSSILIRNKPTLPTNLTNETYDEPLLVTKKPEGEQLSECSGPSPPKSWAARLTNAHQDIYLTSSWRGDALSLLYTQMGATVAGEDILPLSMMCLLPLISSYTVSELRSDVLPFIPPHLRKEAVRYNAVHHPLPSSKLFLLYEDEGHADGEIIVVGPNTTLRDDYFIQPNQGKSGARSQQVGSSSSGQEEEEVDWENDDASPKLLQTFAAVSMKISMSTILTLPPTITNLVLVHLLSPIALHRLPQTCPLLMFLDLSYNEWLEHPSSETLQSLDRVDWSRWGRLRTLGWRNCFMSDAMLVKLNTGRWDNMSIIQ